MKHAEYKKEISRLEEEVGRLEQRSERLFENAEKDRLRVEKITDTAKVEIMKRDAIIHRLHVLISGMIRHISRPDTISSMTWFDFDEASK